MTTKTVFNSIALLAFVSTTMADDALVIPQEVEVLVEAGIDFEVVPGVTSAVAAPAYAGIPLTHRKFTSSGRGSNHLKHSLITASRPLRDQ